MGLILHEGRAEMVEKGILDFLGDLFWDWLLSLDAEFNEQEIIERLRTGNVDTVLEGLKIEGDLSIRQRIMNAVIDMTLQSSVDESTKLGLDRIFTLDNPLALIWARLHVADLVTAVTDATRKAIRAFVVEGFQRHLTYDTIARQMRPLLGLTPQSAAQLRNYSTTLFNNGVHGPRYEKLVETMRRRLIAKRAELIAGHETVWAENSGQLDVWDRASKMGLIDISSQKQWIATQTTKTCPVCMALDGLTIPLTEKFDPKTVDLKSTLPPVGAPPLHVACRCSIGLVQTPQERVEIS